MEHLPIFLSVVAEVFCSFCLGKDPVEFIVYCYLDEVSEASGIVYLACFVSQAFVVG
jgi:hypothetical protein